MFRHRDTRQATPCRPRHGLEGESGNVTDSESGNVTDSESGNVTVEFVIWLPLLLLWLTVTADISLLFHERGEAIAILSDVNRQVSVGRLTSEQEAEDAVRARLANIDGLVVDTVIDGGIVTTTVEIPTSEIVRFKPVASVLTDSIRLRADHLIEG